MNKKVILFCGVESTGKSTATNIVSNILCSKGYNVEIEMNNRKLKKSLDFANKQGIRYVIIIGTNVIW